MKTGEVLLLILALLGALVANGCTASQDVQQKSSVQATVVTKIVKEFDISAKKFSFEPSVITVKKGDTVRLKVTSLDVDHGIGIPEFNVNLKVSQERQKQSSL